MTGPLVTVVVPTFRHPDFLAQTLPAVLSQTYDPLEIIVSDDGSGDRTPEVVGRFPSRRLRFRQNQETAGICAHLNQCLAEARGKYFVVISDDDLVSPDFVASQVALLEAHPEATVCLSRCRTIDREGRAMNDLGCPDWTTYPGIEFLLDWLTRRNPVHFATLFSMVTRTDFLRQLGGYPVFRWGSNLENAVFIGLALQGAVGFAPEALFQYRVYGASSGLGVSPSLLAHAFSDYLSYINGDTSVGNLLNRLPASQANAIRKGAARGSAEYYLRWLAGKSAAGRMPVRDLARALGSYSSSAAYAQALCRFPVYLTKQVLSRWGLARQWPPA